MAEVQLPQLLIGNRIKWNDTYEKKYSPSGLTDSDVGFVVEDYKTLFVKYANGTIYDIEQNEFVDELDYDKIDNGTPFLYRKYVSHAINLQPVRKYFKSEHLFKKNYTYYMYVLNQKLFSTRNWISVDLLELDSDNNLVCPDDIYVGEAKKDALNNINSEFITPMYNSVSKTSIPEDLFVGKFIYQNIDLSETYCGNEAIYQAYCRYPFGSKILLFKKVNDGYLELRSRKTYKCFDANDILAIRKSNDKKSVDELIELDSGIVLGVSIADSLINLINKYNIVINMDEDIVEQLNRYFENKPIYFTEKDDEHFILTPKASCYAESAKRLLRDKK